MSAVITISSSPERLPPRTPAPPTPEARDLYDAPVPDSSPDSIISPSELCRLPMRSKYFEKETLAEKPQSEDAIMEKTASITAGRKRKPAGKKQPTRGNKATAKMVTSATGDPALPERKTNAPKKTTEPKKKRASKGDKSTNKVLTGRVAKAGSVQSQDSGKKSKAIPASDCSPRQQSASDAVDREEDGLQLEAAMRRRMDWTPTRDTSDGTKDIAEQGADVDKEGGALGFGNLVSGYNFSGTTAASHNNTDSSSDGGPTKRRRIDLVDSMLRPLKPAALQAVDEESTEDVLSDKAPEPKKKPRRPKKLTTITARMTAQYQDDYLELYGPSTKEATDDPDNATVNTKGRKSRKKAASKSKPEVIILSPEDAVKSVNEQDLVFGTCSQLEREDSPTMLKDLQAAIRESEMTATVSQPICSMLQNTDEGLSSAGAVSRFGTPKNLWSVATRDLDGSLLDAEVLDLTESPQAKGTSAFATDATATTKRDSTEDLPEKSSPDGVVNKGKQSSVVPTQRSKDAPKETKKKPGIAATKIPEDHDQMPNYDGLTDAQLSKKVAEFGFKALRGRRKMIELLEKCWESKHGPSSQQSSLAKQSNATSEPQPPTATKKTAKSKQAPKAAKPKENPKPGRPKKLTSHNTATASPAREQSEDAVPKPQPTKTSSLFSYKDVEEIEDSEEEVIFSPIRPQKQLDLLAPPTATTTLPLSTTSASPSRTVPKSKSGNDPTKQNTEGLADRITMAVRAQPRVVALDARKDLTWQEKIVMYDPLIIEDFTAWLNTEGLGLVNEDREVHLAFVRQWCEQRGICCCYRRINKR